MTARDGPADSRPARPGRPASTPDLMATLAGRLTARDRWLLRMLHEHRVLTSAQITQLAFGTTRAATARLLILHRYRAVDRFRPLARRGSAPWHFVLGEAGARVLAAEDGVTLTQLGYRRDRALDIAVSPQLAHTTGANGFFTALAAAARAGHGQLACWWGERRCAALWGDLARPDGYARWRGHNGGQPAEAEFFLEYDTGTEDLPRLAAKLAGYRMLAERTGIITPVLFWLPGPRRETALHALLARDPRPGADRVPVATATPVLAGEDGPEGPAWLPAGTPGPRRQLAQLPAAWPATESTTADPPSGGPAPADPPGLPWHPPDPAPPGPG